eukprot:scaffold3854_cov251-Pinguiococcus_pyrenoidosus.AAC.5
MMRQGALLVLAYLSTCSCFVPSPPRRAAVQLAAERIQYEAIQHVGVLVSEVRPMGDCDYDEGQLLSRSWLRRLRERRTSTSTSSASQMSPICGTRSCRIPGPSSKLQEASRSIWYVA